MILASAVLILLVGLPQNGTGASLIEPGSAPVQPASTNNLPRVSTAFETWVGPEGTHLPFNAEDDLLDFLSTAEFTSQKTLTDGLTRPAKVLLVQGDVSMYAVFRTVDIFKRETDKLHRPLVPFRDCYRYETAAYRISRILGFDFVPPTVNRKYRGKRGSLQAWVEGAMTERERNDSNIEPPVTARRMHDFQSMWLFDNLIFNDDRNQGNILLDEDWRMWLIDASRAFRPFAHLKNPTLIRQVDRRVWHKLTTVPDHVLKTALKDTLSKNELQGILKRRAALVELIANLIEQRGPEAVLFDRSKDESANITDECETSPP